MDKWEKVFKYAVYMAYEIVAHARCPRGPVWHRPEAKMFNLLLPQLLRLRKQIDQIGAGLKQPICLNVVAGDNVLLETWTVHLKPHELQGGNTKERKTGKKSSVSSTTTQGGMSKALLELSVFLRSLQSYVHVLPAASRSLRNRNETYTITLSVPGKQKFEEGSSTITYPFNNISSILGIFEFKVTYRELREEQFTNNRIRVGSMGNNNTTDVDGTLTSAQTDGIIKDYIPGPSPLTRVSSNPRKIPTSKYNGTHAPSSNVSVDNRNSESSSYGHNEQGRDRAFSYGTATALGNLATSNFSVGTPPLHPSSLGSGQGQARFWSNPTTTQNNNVPTLTSPPL